MDFDISIFIYSPDQLTFLEDNIFSVKRFNSEIKISYRKMISGQNLNQSIVDFFSDIESTYGINKKNEVTLMIGGFCDVNKALNANAFIDKNSIALMSRMGINLEVSYYPSI
jgi:hypothetical protein